MSEAATLVRAKNEMVDVEENEGLPLKERESRANEIYLDHFQNWFLGDEENEGKGGAIRRLVGLANAESNLKQGKLTRKQEDAYFEGTVRFETDYARWILSMPKGVKDSRKFAEMVELAVNNPKKVSRRNVDFVRRAIVGSVATVTFMELMMSMGEEYGDLTLEDFEIDVEYDKNGATDFGISVGDKIFQIQLKSIGGVDNFDGRMVQEVTQGAVSEEGAIRFGNRYLKKASAKRMLGVKKEWEESERETDGSREVVSLVVFVPSMDYQEIDRWTGFLRDHPKVQDGVNGLKELFGKRMRDFGFIIKSEDEQEEARV